MNVAEAEIYLRCHRPGRDWNDSDLSRALQASRSNPELTRLVAEQGRFDTQIADAVHAISLPAELKARLEALVNPSTKASEAISPRLVQFAILAVVCGLAVIVGLAVSMEINRRADFPGRENVTRIVGTADGMSGAELDPVSKPLRDMDDWFFMRGFEGFTVPAEMANLPGLGARVIHIEGKRVAQVAVDQQSSLLYVFRASEFGVEIPDRADWEILEREGWVAALRREGSLCVVIAFRGTRAQMRDFLHNFPTSA